MPSTTTRPEVSVSRPPRILMSVVFPEPEGPIRAIHSPAWTLKRRSSSARSAPYFFTNESTATWDVTCRLTLHLEKRKLGGCSQADAMETLRQSRQLRSVPRPQDTQPGGSAPPRQNRLVRDPSGAPFPPRPRPNPPPVRA